MLLSSDFSTALPGGLFPKVEQRSQWRKLLKPDGRLPHPHVCSTFYKTMHLIFLLVCLVFFLKNFLELEAL